MSSARDCDIWYTDAWDLVTVFVNFRHQNEIVMSRERSGRLHAVIHFAKFVHESRIHDPRDGRKSVTIRARRKQSAIAYTRETSRGGQDAAAHPFIESDDQSPVHSSILRWVGGVLIEWEICRH